MKKLLHIILSLLIISSCMDGGATDIPSEATISDTMPAILTVADTATVQDTMLMSLSPKQVDSLVFRLTHHYSENFNFLVKADSLTLIPREGDLITDTCRVYAGDVIAVAAIKAMPNDSIDSIWVKVASSQYTMGWIPEQELLRGTTPDDTISEILDALSSSRIIWMTALISLGAIALILGKRKRFEKPLILRFEEMNSIYPPLFLLLVAMMASLYASVQNFVPEFWQEYYFHPTLNPLMLPHVMAALVVIMWLVIITFIAVIDEVYNRFSFQQGITYLAELIGAAMLIYLVISWTTFVYIGYILLLVLTILLLRRIFQCIK